jgi:triosephosphate isomerase
MTRKPVAVSNWKMAMTIAESLAWVRGFQASAGDLLDVVDVVVCPPFTALWTTSQALRGSRIQLAGQNMAPTADPARMGEISAKLLIDVGCRRVVLGHWEVRRHLGDDDDMVNRKVRLALEAGLAPMLLVGEGRDEKAPLPDVLQRGLERVLDGCRAEQVETMILTYEPEGAIGVAAPASPEQAAAGCGFIREWIRERWGNTVADHVRLMYGGSVAPEYAADLLSSPDVDGLGATRRGRNPEAFAEIVRQVARMGLGQRE